MDHCSRRRCTSHPVLGMRFCAGLVLSNETFAADHQSYLAWPGLAWHATPSGMVLYCRAVVLLCTEIRHGIGSFKSGYMNVVQVR